MNRDDIQTLIYCIPDMPGYETDATLQDIESALVQLEAENKRLGELGWRALEELDRLPFTENDDFDVFKKEFEVALGGE